MAHIARAKHKSKADEGPHINGADIVRFDGTEEFTYLKSVELIKYKPHHFGLDRWQFHFRLSDAWMKKIYINEVYKDSDLPEPETERISPQQRKVLDDWLKRQLNYSLEPELSFKRCRQPPVDRLIEIIEKSSERYELDIGEGNSRDVDADPCRSHRQSTPLSELTTENISLCLKHPIQPENVIVTLAMQKMKDLDVEDENRYQELLRDRDFMQLLNSEVEKFLKTEGP